MPRMVFVSKLFGSLVGVQFGTMYLLSRTTINVNREVKDEDIMNLFVFTLKDTILKWC